MAERRRADDLTSAAPMTIVAVEAFGTYRKGAPITDPATAAAILAGPNRVFVVEIADATEALPAPQPQAPASTSSGDLPSLAVATALGAGMPVTFSRAAGRLVAARADTKALSFVMGVLNADVAADHAASPARGVVTLADWSAATGAAQLVAGAPYYLDAAGGLTAEPDRGRICNIVTVGVALSGTALMVAPTTPFQL